MTGSLVTFLLGLATATTAPATLPATRPFSALSPGPSVPLAAPPFKPAPKSLPKDYAVLNFRSIFFKGRGPLPASGGPDEIRNLSKTSSSGPPTEETLVFNGVTETEDGTISSHEVQLVQVGQPLAAGKIIGLTLHQLDYAAAGKIVHVEIGENLAGQLVEASTQPTEEPIVAPAPISSGAGGANNVLERMKKRREQELGGK
jgi:hypothetical protein